MSKQTQHKSSLKYHYLKSKKNFHTTLNRSLSSCRLKISRFSVFKKRILVNEVAECDVVKIVFSTDEDIELLIQHGEFATTHHAPKIQLAQHAMKLTTRDGAIVYAVVVLEQGEHLNATLAHAVRETMHDFFEHLISILREPVQV